MLKYRPQVRQLDSRVVPSVAPVGTEFPVPTLTTNFQGNPAVAKAADGRFVVAWESIHTGSYEIYFRRYNAAGQPSGTEVRANTYTTASQRSPAIAIDGDGDFVIVWESNDQDGSGYGVYGQRFNANGTPQGGEFRVNTATTDNQLRPSVAMDADGDFVVAWQSLENFANGYDVYFQRYNNQGVAQGSAARANVTTTDYQVQPAVAMDADGNFVVTWDGYFQSGDTGYGVYARRYDNTGTPLTSEFRVNTYTTGNQRNSAVAMSGPGDFVVTWQSHNQDGGGYGIYARRYAGGAGGTVWRVNQVTAGDQIDPSVALQGPSHAVFAWTGPDPAGGLNSTQIYARRYALTGSPDGDEFRANTHTTGPQARSAVASTAGGEFVVVWQSQDQDGSGWGVYGQRFRPDDPPGVTGVVINDGGASRSRVAQLSVAFDTVVSLPADPATAFSVLGPGGAIGLNVTTFGSPGTHTVARLTFFGAGTEAGSVADGNYVLRVFGQLVTANGIALDGDGDGTPGGDFTFAFFRLYGDIDGNRTVNFSDFLALRSSFGLTTGQPGFQMTFDWNGNQVIDFTDFLAFRARFGVYLAP